MLQNDVVNAPTDNVAWINPKVLPSYWAQKGHPGTVRTEWLPNFPWISYADSLPLKDVCSVLPSGKASELSKTAFTSRSNDDK